MGSHFTLPREKKRIAVTAWNMLPTWPWGYDRFKRGTLLVSKIRRGDSDAQLSLGICYQRGEGITIDLEKAVYWYQKSAEAGNSAAQVILEMCYKLGKGVVLCIRKWSHNRFRKGGLLLSKIC